MSHLVNTWRRLLTNLGLVAGRRAPARRSVSLTMECLEDRRVPATLGPDAFGYRASAMPDQNSLLGQGQPGVFSIPMDPSFAWGVDLQGNTFNFYGSTSREVTVYGNGTIRPDLYSVPTLNVLRDNWGDGYGLGKFEDIDHDFIMDRLIVQWTNMKHLPFSPARVTFQAILQLNTGTRAGDIIYNYSNVATGDPASNNGASATVSIYGGALAYSLEVPQANAWVGSGKAIRFTVTPPNFGVLQFATPTYSVGENGGSATVTVSRTAGSDGSVSVAYATSDGTARAGSDYTVTSGILSFAEGETSKTITIPITDDAIFEGSETFNLTLSNPTGGAALGTPKTAVVTITDNDAQPNLWVTDAYLTDANGNRLEQPAAGTSVLVWVAFQTRDLPAGTQYGIRRTMDDTTWTHFVDWGAGSTGTGSWVHFAGYWTVGPGQHTVTIVLDSTNNIAESSESDNSRTVTFTASNPPPPLPQLAINDVSLAEGNSGTTSLNFTVSLSAAGSQPVTVQYATTDGTAIAGSDYTATSGTLTFAAGETQKTVTVRVNGDTSVETDETFFVRLSNPTSATLADAEGTGTIQNDDSQQTADRRVSIESVQAGPGQTVTVPVNLSDAAGLQAVDFTLTYDPALLWVSPADVRPGNLVPSWTLQANVVTPGTLVATLFTTAPMIGGAGSVALIDFHVSASAATGATSPLRLPQVKLNEGRLTATTADGSLTVAARSFQVVNFQPAVSGFEARLNRDVNLDKLNLYRGQSAGGAADATLVGAASGPVAGSLLWDAASRTLSFIKSGGPLAPDNYTATLFSRADAVTDSSGELLDGNGDGSAGGDCVKTFTVAASSERIVSLPDFARGPGQAVNVPATGTGLPVRIDQTNGVRSFDFRLRFDPALLKVTNVSLAPGMPADWQLTWNGTTAGQVTLTAFGTQPLASGARDLVVLRAEVPATAPYAAAEAVRLENVRLNEGNIAARTDVAVHKVAYVGDTTGNHTYSALDASLLARVVALLDTGFDVYLLTDPLLVGDVTGDGSLSGLDASYIVGKAVGLLQPEVPDLPGVLPPSATSGIDPIVSLPGGVLRRGETRVLPVTIDNAAGLQAVDMMIEYDPAVLSIAAEDVLASGLTASWTRAVRGEAGCVRLSLFSPQPLAGGSGELFSIRLRVRDDAPSGSSALHFVSGSQLNEGRLVLTPVDGVLVLPAPDTQVTGAAAGAPNADVVSEPVAPSRPGRRHRHPKRSRPRHPRLGHRRR